MKIARSFTFAFKSPKGTTKVLRGGLYTALFFTVFLPFAAAGFLVRLMCDLLEGRDASLPKWNDLRGLFDDGLLPVIISLAYGAPLLLCSILQLYLDTLVLSIVQITCAVAVSLLLPLGLIHFLTSRNIRAAFDLRSAVRLIQGNTRPVLTAWGISITLHGAAALISIGTWLGTALLVSLVASKIAGVSTGLVLGFVVFAFSDFIVTVISSHLYAQAYRASTPFTDDAEGSIRASVVLPPSLHKRPR